MQQWDLHSLFSVSVYSFPCKEDGNRVHKCLKRWYTWLYEWKKQEREKPNGRFTLRPLKKKEEWLCVFGGAVAQQVVGLMEAPGSVATEWVSECMFSKGRGVMGGSSMGWNHWCIFIDRAASRPNKGICGSRPLPWTNARERKRATEAPMETKESQEADL